MSFEFEASFFCSLLRDHGARPRKVLIVGCGDGTEARHIASTTGASVTGIDVRTDLRPAGPGIDLLRADGRCLPFPDRCFDALYCYHVLEHIPGPHRAVSEMRRVLVPGALGFFGTPNRSRLVGYLGGRAGWADKMRWNVADWRKRLAGEWTNEQGAHAGFTSRDLAALVGTAFARVVDVAPAYYGAKYRRVAAVWSGISAVGLDRFAAPSVYMLASDETGPLKG